MNQNSGLSRPKIIGAFLFLWLLSFPAHVPEAGGICFLIALLVGATYFLTDYPKIKKFWDEINPNSTPQKEESPISDDDYPYYLRLREHWGDYCDSLGINRAGKEKYISKTALVTQRKIVKKERETYDRAQVYESRSTPRGLEWKFTIPMGVQIDRFEKGIRSLCMALGVETIEVFSDGVNLGRMLAHTQDPLASSLVLEKPVLSEGYEKIPCALNAEGETVELTLKNNSGIVVGGRPGSGKTAGITSSLIGSLLTNDCVQFIVIDGKGGADWEWIESRATKFLSTTKDLEAVAEISSQVVEIMEERLATQKKKFGVSNFWQISPSPEHPLIFFIVDECQNFFETRAIIGKERKALSEQIINDSLDIVRMGRSAGMVGLFLTQKPTSDVIPTALRDNCGDAIAFRVRSAEAAKAILGAVDLSEISPAEMPKQPGRAVMEIDGDLQQVLFPYVPEENLEGVATDHAHLRRDFSGLLG